MINPPKWWFNSIEEVLNAPSDYPIYVPSNSITYYSLKSRSQYDNPIFEKLIRKIKTLPIEEMYSLKFVKRFYTGKCATFSTSIQQEFHKIMLEHEVVFNKIRYDNVLDVRFIRKDFQFSDQMVQM